MSTRNNPVVLSPIRGAGGHRDQPISQGADILEKIKSMQIKLDSIIAFIEAGQLRVEKREREDARKVYSDDDVNGDRQDLVRELRTRSKDGRDQFTSDTLLAATMENVIGSSAKPWDERIQLFEKMLGWFSRSDRPETMISLKSMFRCALALEFSFDCKTYSDQMRVFADSKCVDDVKTYFDRILDDGDLVQGEFNDGEKSLLVQSTVTLCGKLDVVEDFANRMYGDRFACGEMIRGLRDLRKWINTKKV